MVFAQKHGDKGIRWGDESDNWLCCVIGNDDGAPSELAPFIALFSPTIPGATWGECQAIQAAHAQEVSDLHARMRATLAGLRARHMPAGAFEVAHDRR